MKAFAAKFTNRDRWFCFISLVILGIWTMFIPHASKQKPLIFGIIVVCLAIIGLLLFPELLLKAVSMFAMIICVSYGGFVWFMRMIGSAFVPFISVGRSAEKEDAYILLGVFIIISFTILLFITSFRKGKDALSQIKDGEKKITMPNKTTKELLLALEALKAGGLMDENEYYAKRNELLSRM